jgi:ribosomal protein S27AE
MTEAPERKKIYHKRLKSGLCPRCGGRVKKSSPYKTCDSCREFYRNYQKANSDTVQEIRRERYAKRKAKNLCPRCGVPLGKKYKTTLCAKCLDKQYQYNNGVKRSKKRK